MDVNNDVEMSSQDHRQCTTSHGSVSLDIEIVQVKRPYKCTREAVAVMFKVAPCAALDKLPIASLFYSVTSIDLFCITQRAACCASLQGRIGVVPSSCCRKSI